MFHSLKAVTMRANWIFPNLFLAGLARVVRYSTTIPLFLKKRKSQVFLAFINFPRLVVPLGMPAGIQIKSPALFARYSSLQNDHVCQLRVRCNIKVTPSLMFSCQKKTNLAWAGSVAYLYKANQNNREARSFLTPTNYGTFYFLVTGAWSNCVFFSVFKRPTMQRVEHGSGRLWWLYGKQLVRLELLQWNVRKWCKDS